MRPTTTRRRPTPTACLAIVLAALTAGCSTSSGDDAPDETASTSTTTAATESPEQACARQVSYWVGESLRLGPDQGYDYQHMGLSGRTYDVVRAVTAEARAAGRSEPAWVAERASAACEQVIRGRPAATSTSGGWP